MKRNVFPPAALICMIFGLVVMTLTPIISGQFMLPDLVKGLAMGSGFGLEMLAIIMIQKARKNKSRFC